LRQRLPAAPPQGKVAGEPGPAATPKLAPGPMVRILSGESWEFDRVLTMYAGGSRRFRSGLKRVVMRRTVTTRRRATLLLMVVGLLASLFLLLSAYLTLARFDSLTLQTTRQADTIRQVLDSIDQVVLSTVVQSWADAEGNLLAGGRKRSGSDEVLESYMPVDVPGYRGTSWLAGIEPVADRRFLPGTLPPNWPAEISPLWPYRQIVSSFLGPRLRVPPAPFVGWPENWLYSLAPAQPGLLLEDSADGDDQFLNSDLLRNVRRPFMDADGDGVPDSLFAAMAPLTEVANAIAGVPVRAPSKRDPISGTLFDPSAIGSPQSTYSGQAWQRFAQQARYEVAAKIVSNGGLVALTSPGVHSPPGWRVWNREFVAGMFNWVRHHPAEGRPDVYDRPLLAAGAADGAFLNDIWNEAQAVEPFLRYRGGTLISYLEAQCGQQQQAVGLPASLVTFWQEFFNTATVALWPGFPWQRVNLANLQEGWQWSAWRRATTLDPDDFNTNAHGLLQAYSRRRLLTTISNSDDLAQELDPDHPNLRNPALPDHDMGIYRGQLKFYLGRIAVAFTYDGLFNPLDSRGRLIIEQLADLYYEMLTPYRGWAGQTGATEVVTRRQQAFMLAVNTVAFAAPRDALGFGGAIDAPWYLDGQRLYVGYVPQLYITQAVMYNEAQQEQEPGAPKYALGLELYFPHDPHPQVNPAVESKFDNPRDPYALDLEQYAISLNNDTDPVQFRNLFTATGHRRLSGRNFLTLSIRGPSGPTVFENGIGPASGPPDGFVRDLAVQRYPGGLPPQQQGGQNHQGVLIRLWRWSFSMDGWYLVDEFRLDFGEENGSAVDPDDEEDWVAFAARDCRPDLHLGGFDADNNGPDHPARWRVVMPIEAEAGKVVQGAGATERLAEQKSYLGDEQPFGRHAPSIPLYTANAGSTDYASAPAPWNRVLPRGFFTPEPIHGVYRPRSFPTVGFLLFVPRYSHVAEVAGSVMQWVPMNQTLREQWHEWESPRGLNAQEGIYPADFGHMPVFDNRQEAEGLFDDDALGRIPWGLQVFNYFTTLDPEADYDGNDQADVDPYRVPGRININTAPWYVLAGLPVVDPESLGADQDYESPDPAFWSSVSGVLVGQVRGPVFASFPNQSLNRFGGDSSYGLIYDDEVRWYRLGSQLAQAIVSYRDQLRYTSAGLPVASRNPLWSADRRNGPSDLGVPDPQVFYRREDAGSPVWLGGYSYGVIRRGTEDQPKLGFLSIGELANVRGFDSPVYNPAYPGDTSLMLYNPLGKAASQPTNTPDFFKAVNLLALLDSHFITTRSNTFTVYLTVTDRDPQRQQASVRVQYTLDRSNLLPRLVLDRLDRRPLLQDTNGDLIPDSPVIVENRGLPEVIGRREVGYFNTWFDQ
jgi:hypothetical protein